MTPAATVDTATIIEQLSLSDTFPRQALEAAAANRAELVPKFLREIDAFLAMASEDRVGVPTPLFYAFHLLAEWRETAAYRPLLSVLQLPFEDIDELLGDAVTETAARVVASVYDGDPQPVIDIINDPDAGPNVRWQMFKTLTILVLRNKLERSRVVSFLHDCVTVLPQAKHQVWLGWMQTIAALGVVELAPHVRSAFDQGFIAADFFSFDEFEAFLQDGVAGTASNDRVYSLFGDTGEELANWARINEAVADGKSITSAELAKLLAMSDEDFATELYHRINATKALQYSSLAPETNALRSVGRNDPCPCDSGKKYKKCCLN
jgi:hypothetical protein